MEGKLLITDWNVPESRLNGGIDGLGALQWTGKITLDFVSSGKAPLNREDLVDLILKQILEIKEINLY